MILKHPSVRVEGKQLAKETMMGGFDEQKKVQAEEGEEYKDNAGFEQLEEEDQSGCGFRIKDGRVIAGREDYGGCDPHPLEEDPVKAEFARNRISYAKRQEMVEEQLAQKRAAGEAEEEGNPWEPKEIPEVECKRCGKRQPITQADFLGFSETDEYGFTVNFACNCDGRFGVHVSKLTEHPELLHKFLDRTEESEALEELVFGKKHKRSPRK
jgi:hypothetical protein